MLEQVMQRGPNIQINVVDINQQRINEWNIIDLQKLPIVETGIDKIIRLYLLNKYTILSLPLLGKLYCIKII